VGGLAAVWFGLQFDFSAALLAGAATFARAWFTELHPMAWITVTDDETTAAIVHSVGAIVVLVVATVAIDR
jgi:hypothetical protein